MQTVDLEPRGESLVDLEEQWVKVFKLESKANVHIILIYNPNIFILMEN